MKLFEFGDAAVDASKVEGVYLCHRTVIDEHYISGSNTWYEVRILTTTQNEYTSHSYSNYAKAEAKFNECKELLRAINE